MKKPQPTKKIEGLEHIDKVLILTKIGRTPSLILQRTPKFYRNQKSVYDDPERIRGYKRDDLVLM
jgi:hypothetical protein